MGTGCLFQFTYCESVTLSSVSAVKLSSVACLLAQIVLPI